MADFKAKVHTMFELDLAEGLRLTSVKRTDHAELTRWEGELTKDGSPHGFKGPAFIWTHREEKGIRGFFREMFEDVKVNSLQVVAISENLEVALGVPSKGVAPISTGIVLNVDPDEIDGA